MSNNIAIVSDNEIKSQGKMLNIVDYDKLKVTTMTLVSNFSITVDKDAAVALLPVVDPTNMIFTKYTKTKVPICDTPGSIIRLRYKDISRGFTTSNDESTPFKNTITLAMSIGHKNVNIKLSPLTLQMTGAQSFNDGVDASKYMCEKLILAQNMLIYVQESAQRYDEILEWLKTNTLGPAITREIITHKTLKNDTILSISDTIDDNKVVYPQVEIPEKFNKKYMELLISYVVDYRYHSSYMKKLQSIRTMNNIFKGDLEIVHVREAMVNFNYTLGFEVDRFALNQRIDNNNGFLSRFNNALNSYVTVELPYEVDDETLKKRKNKIPHHTFIVYRSGAVTQSGPSYQLMKSAYYLFMNTIKSFEDVIQYKGY